VSERAKVRRYADHNHQEEDKTPTDHSLFSNMTIMYADTPTGELRCPSDSGIADENKEGQPELALAEIR
jgi:hypothetical protein